MPFPGVQYGVPQFLIVSGSMKGWVGHLWLLLSCRSLFPSGIQSEFRGLRTFVFSAPVGYLYEISRESLECGREGTM